MSFRYFLLILFAAGGFAGLAFAGAMGGIISLGGIPERKQTQSSYYLTSEQVHDILQDDPSILFIDVRTYEEVEASGHPHPVDAIVPYQVQSEIWDSDLQEFTLVENAAFVTKIRALLNEAGRSQYDMIIITCGSGVRSAAAARMLEDSGFNNVWHIPDGYDGDDKPGLNIQNAWKNKGLPWSGDVSAVFF